MERVIRVEHMTDTIKDTLDVYDFDMETGVPSNPKPFFGPQDRGNMDGSAMDADGYIWNARWGGGCLIRFAPDGSVDRVIDLPVTQPTSCVFGGPDLKTLYITSASVGLGTGASGAATPCEEALRALFVGDDAALAANIADWPGDVAAYVHRLAGLDEADG